MESLWKEWHALLAEWAIPCSDAESIYVELVHSYSSPDRHYHNLSHVDHVLQTIGGILAPQPIPPSLALAAWYHDVIYDPRAGDNEERSADKAESDLRSVQIEMRTVVRVRRLILLTKTHKAPLNDRDGQVLLDADLAVLGASVECYDAYATAIRQEYAWVPQADYRNGRQQVLEAFLRMPRIYQTDSLYQTHETQARLNMQREIDILKEADA